MKLHLSFSLAIAATATLVACSSNTPSHATDAQSSTDGSDATANSETSVFDDGSAPTQRYGGFVYVSLLTTANIDGGTTTIGYEDALFESFAMNGPVTTSSSCIFSGGIPTATPLNAGTITITGGTEPPVTIAALSDGGISSARQESTSWNASDQLSISAAGDTIPAFQTTLMVPARITVTDPPASRFDPDAGGQPFDTHQPFALSWTGGRAGDQVAITITTSEAHEAKALQCHFPAANGSASIPASDMNLLSPTGEYLINIYAENLVSVFAGPYVIQVSINDSTDLFSVHGMH